mmetsp:Transcript_10784/g.35744  ORF Transcript_10784/g.35744 Transcript_10784/m.35744 type:complete len:208 (-) Transcript_10784:140-763(-)
MEKTRADDTSATAAVGVRRSLAWSNDVTATLQRRQKSAVWQYSDVEHHTFVTDSATNTPPSNAHRAVSSSSPPLRRASTRGATMVPWTTQATALAEPATMATRSSPAKHRSNARSNDPLSFSSAQLASTRRVNDATSSASASPGSIAVVTVSRAPLANNGRRPTSDNGTHATTDAATSESSTNHFFLLVTQGSASTVVFGNSGARSP